MPRKQARPLFRPGFESFHLFHSAVCALPSLMVWRNGRHKHRFISWERADQLARWAAALEKKRKVKRTLWTSWAFGWSCEPRRPRRRRKKVTA